METKLTSHELKGTNGNAIGSFLIGIISIFGIFFIGEGAYLSVAGLLLGIFGFRETNKRRQKGRNFALLGIIFNCFGVFSLFFP